MRRNVSPVRNVQFSLISINNGSRKLLGFIIHQGVFTNSGHYINWVRYSNKWYHCSDHIVHCSPHPKKYSGSTVLSCYPTAIPIAQIASDYQGSTVYLLFYIKQIDIETLVCFLVSTFGLIDCLVVC